VSPLCADFEPGAQRYAKSGRPPQPVTPQRGVPAVGAGVKMCPVGGPLLHLTVAPGGGFGDTVGG